MDAMCKQIHHQLVREFKYALVWGLSAKHSPQRVGLVHQLADEDVVQVGVGTRRDMNPMHHSSILACIVAPLLFLATGEMDHACQPSQSVQE